MINIFSNLYLVATYILFSVTATAHMLTVWTGRLGHSQFPFLWSCTLLIEVIFLPRYAISIHWHRKFPNFCSVLADSHRSRILSLFGKACVLDSIFRYKKVQDLMGKKYHLIIVYGPKMTVLTLFFHRCSWTQCCSFN